MTAEPTSPRVDLADLGGFIGTEPGRTMTAGQTASQRSEVARAEAQPRLIPDTPINVPKLRWASVHLHYRGQTIEGRSVPLAGRSLQVGAAPGRDPTMGNRGSSRRQFYRSGVFKLTARPRACSARNTGERRHRSWNWEESPEQHGCPHRLLAQISRPFASMAAGYCEPQARRFRRLEGAEKKAGQRAHGASSQANPQPGTVYQGVLSIARFNTRERARRIAQRSIG